MAHVLNLNVRYNFTPIQRYKTLDAEEAEERFANRGKVLFNLPRLQHLELDWCPQVLNKWSVMVHRKLKPDQEDAELDGEEGEKKGKKVKVLLWMMSLSLSPSLIHHPLQLKGAEKKEFKISDMDEWEGSDDGLDTDEEKVTYDHMAEKVKIIFVWLKEKKDDSDDDGKGKKRSKDSKKKNKKKDEADDEAFDDSEDDDRQDREV